VTATLEPAPSAVSPRRGRGAVAGWLVAVAAAAGLLGVYVLAVRTSAGQRVDDRLMQWASAVAGRAAWAESVLDGAGAPLTLLAVTAGVVVLALLVHGRGRAVAVAAVAVGTVLGAQVLKVALERPVLTDQVAHNSFPSGHVAAVAGVAAALVLAAPRVLRPLFAVSGLVVVVVVGLATTALAWHRPSDVVGSVLLALAWAGAGAALSSRSAASHH
jgi:membrane-associated phospholipid phosphatase